MTDVRVTQQVIEAVQQDDAIDVRLTQMAIEAVQQDDSIDLRLTQMVIEVVHSGDCPIITPSVCPGEVDMLRIDGLPYANTDPAACGGAGTVTGSRTGQ